ncbi:mitochondrial carnitine/acylcarnitine carrier protein CACL-like protein, partial [Rozella allomycis CSF55]
MANSSNLDTGQINPTDDYNVQGFIHPSIANFISGTFAGLGGVLAGQPFDTVKVRLQSQDVVNPKIRKKIYFHFLALGLLKGISAPMIGVTLVNSFLFGVYGSILNYQLNDPKEKPSLEQIFVAGAGSGFLNSIISGPTELAKIQLQNQVKKGDRNAYKGTFNCLSRIYRVKGFRGCFRGISATILRETPSYGAYFSSYEYICRKLSKDGDSSQLNPMLLMFAGGMAGICSWITTYPFDVVKTVMQSEHFDQPFRYRNTWAVFKDHYKNHGINFFFRGLNATIVRAFPTNAVTFFAYSTAMKT